MTLAFGTSGLRGLVKEMTDLECYLYATAYLQYLKDKDNVKKDDVIYIAGDMRPSTERIMKAILKAITDFGLFFENCGKIPTPAVSFFAFKRGSPSIMVTGSHNPYTNNGIKFNMPFGEVLKDDEKGILERYENIKKVELLNKGSLFDESGMFLKSTEIYIGEINPEAGKVYIKRYTDFFSAGCLSEKRIVVYQQSSVIRDILPEIIKSLGGEIINVGRSDEFIPVDTEAIRPEDIELAEKWSDEYKPFAIISADGDGDRPLIFDENGKVLHGDIIGILVSLYLKADSVSTPISCNTSIDKVNKFRKINKTKIGSPYVIASMNESIKEGFMRVVSYEANGGFLLGSDIEINGKILSALPTRDSVTPIICTLLSAIDNNITLSDIVADLPQRFTHSTKLKEFSKEKSTAIIQKLSGKNGKGDAESYFGFPCGSIRKIDYTDGVRMLFKNGDIVHIRPSGNAPELRCYTEAGSVERARILNKKALSIIEKNQ